VLTPGSQAKTSNVSKLSPADQTLSSFVFKLSAGTLPDWLGSLESLEGFHKAARPKPTLLATCPLLTKPYSHLCMR
jgi:hypothetical protein